MSTAASPRLVTVEQFSDFVQRPENLDRRFELENGEIVEMSRHGELHGFVCGNVAYILGTYIRKVRKGRVITNDSGLIVFRDPDTVRGPDAMLFTDSKGYDELEPKFIEAMPALVVEVLSPTDRPSRLTRKLNRFLDKGVAVVWMIDPEEKSVTLWWTGQAPIVLEGDEEIVNLPGLPEFRCKVSELFESMGA